MLVAIAGDFSFVYAMRYTTYVLSLIDQTSKLDQPTQHAFNAGLYTQLCRYLVTVVMNRQVRPPAGRAV